MLPYVLLIIGFVLLIKGADLLVDGASSIARQFHVSDLVIGLTVVAFGTSTPELFVNILASVKGNADIAIGNVIGSNISNLFLILGVSTVICPLSVTKGTVWKEIPLSLLAAFLLGILANDHLIDKRDPSVIKPLPFQKKNDVDIGVVILASILLFFAMFTGKKRSLDRWEGIIFLALYMGYIIFLIIQG